MQEQARKQSHTSSQSFHDGHITYFCIFGVLSAILLHHLPVYLGVLYYSTGYLQNSLAPLLTIFDARACLVYLFYALMAVQFRQIACLNAPSRIKASARLVGQTFVSPC